MIPAMSKIPIAHRPVKVQPLTDALETEIREAYVYGRLNDDQERVFPSINGLAAEFNVNMPNLSKKAKKNGWKDARFAHIDECHRQLSIERAKVVARKFAKAEDGMMDLSIKASKIGNKRLDEIIETSCDETGQIGERAVNMAAKAYDKARLAVGKASEITATETPDDPEIQTALHTFRVSNPGATGDGQSPVQNDKPDGHSGVPADDAVKGSGSADG